jgi:asparagine synthase (glutamine-hydrolysing)
VAFVAADVARQDEPLCSFSLVFPGKDCDESRYIEMAKRQCGLLGNELNGVPAPLSHYLEQTKRFLDLCDGPNGAMLDPIRKLARSQCIRVLLTGYGGDEWFGKSGYYYAHLLKNMKLAQLSQQLAFDYKSGQSARSLMNLFCIGDWFLCFQIWQ